MRNLRLAVTTAVIIAALIGIPSVAQAQTCFGQQPNNTPTAGDDVILGTVGDDVLVGGEGNDTIRGFGGNDRLCGNGGNDRIFGSSGLIDRIDGGPGNDELSGGEFFIPCGDSNADTGDALPSLPPGQNTIHGGAGDDQIVGSGYFDGLHGDDGNDCIAGLADSDYITGGSGADLIFAGGGEDTALGNDDFDELWGGDGNDWLYAAFANVQLPRFLTLARNRGNCRGSTDPLKAAMRPARVICSQTCSSAVMDTIRWLVRPGATSCGVTEEATIFMALVVTIFCWAAEAPTVSRGARVGIALMTPTPPTLSLMISTRSGGAAHQTAWMPWTATSWTRLMGEAALLTRARSIGLSTGHFL